MVASRNRGSQRVPMKPGDRIYQRELEQSALLGELARALTHEWNNFLNTLVLQIAVVERELPEPLRNELANIQQEAKGLAELIRQWQSYRPPHATFSGTTAIDHVLRETVADLTEEGIASPDTISLLLESETNMLSGSSAEQKVL